MAFDDPARTERVREDRLRDLGVIAERSGTVERAFLAFYELVVRLRWGRLAPPTPDEQRAIDRLRSGIADLDAGLDDGEVTTEWDAASQRLAQLVLSHDPRTFFSWDVVRRTLAATLNPAGWGYLQTLRAQDDYRSVWKPALPVPSTGRPATLPFAPRTTTNRLSHSRHLAVLREVTGRSVADLDLIVEFGGGFGGLEHLARTHEFTGRYVIIDLPVVRRLQEFYLSLEGACGATEGLAAGAEAGPTTHLIGLDALDELREIVVASADALFVATWSLSESPLDVRERMYELLPEFPLVFVAYQQSFGPIDNMVLAKELAAHSDPSMQWTHRPIVVFRRDRNNPRNHYAIGQRT